MSTPRRFPIKPFVHLLCLLPILVLAYRGATGGLGANPIEAIIRFLGDWGLRLLVAGLAITPLRKVTGWSGLARYRRMIGLWAFSYGLLHLLSYVVLDQFFDWAGIWKAIVKQNFITAGMVAFALLVPLAVTSTNKMAKRLGGARWRLLHRLVYLAVPLVALHYYWMVKAGHFQPLVYAALIVAFLGYRVGESWWQKRRAVAA